MKIVLSEPDLLNEYTMKRKKLYRNRDLSLLKYSDDIYDKIFDNKTSQILEKLGVDKKEMIFIGKKPFSVYCKAISRMKISGADKNQLCKKLLIMLILKGKKIFICAARETNGHYFPNPPKEAVFEIIGDYSEYPELVKANKRINTAGKTPDFSKSKHMRLINDYLSKHNISIVKNYIKSAMNDLVFITRFNEEMFYHGLVLKGNVISEEAAAAIFESDRYTRIIDLSRKNERNAFIALYGMTFCGLELKDVYSIDGIFNMQPNRETDNQKKLAGQKVFDLITRENKDDFISLLESMGKTLQEIPNFRFDINEPETIKKYYSIFVGLSDIGKVFLDIINPNVGYELKKALKSAKRLSEYSFIIDLYNSVYESTNNKKISDDKYYSYAAKIAHKLNANPD